MRATFYARHFKREKQLVCIVLGAIFLSCTTYRFFRKWQSRGCRTVDGIQNQEDTSTTGSSSSVELNEKLNDLYQQENQIFADHKDVWDKAFGFMSKSTDDDTMNENYADFLANTIESNKDFFSEEEYSKGKTWMAAM